MPVLVVAASAVAGLVCWMVGPAAHAREMFVAAGIALIAGVVGQVPMLLSRGLSQGAVAQAGLAASALHLLFCIACGTAVALLNVGNRQAVLLWLLPFYWVTLGGLVVVIVRAIRRAAPAA